MFDGHLFSRKILADIHRVNLNRLQELFGVGPVDPALKKQVEQVGVDVLVIAHDAHDSQGFVYRFRFFNFSPDCSIDKTTESSIRRTIYYRKYNISDILLPFVLYRHY